MISPQASFLMFFVVNLLFWFSMMKRTYDTYNFQMEILDVIHVLAEKDIDDKRPWKWRYETFELVSFHKMAWLFWRPLIVEEWWEDTSFVEEIKNG